jgi:hypothetical protein
MSEDAAAEPVDKAPDPPPGADEDKEPEAGKEPGPESEPADAAPDRSRAVRANRPGAIQDRAGTHRDAVNGFAYADVDADTVVGRDQYNLTFMSAEGRVVRVAKLSETEHRECADGFVDPDGFADLVQRVVADRVVILRGDPAQGRYAAARRLMILDKRPLYAVNPAIDFERLSTGDLQRGGGYICRDLPQGTAFEDFHLSRLTPMLDELDARLVITVDRTRTFAGNNVADLVHEVGQVTDRVAVLRHQLRFRAGRAAQPILADPDVAALVERELSGPGRPGEARIIARQLYAAHRAGLPYARTVAQALRLRDGARLREWFEKLGSLSLQCMAVATAVLAGEPYETVALAAMNLKNRLETANPNNDSRRSLDAPLAPTMRYWLNELGAETVPSRRRVTHGITAPTEVIRYLDQTLQSRVLLHFWSEYDQARVDLLDWLRWCAGHPLEGVRIRTAVATGVLAAKAFDLVRAVVIEPWTREDDPMFRLVAAEALTVTAQREGLRDAVQELLDFWSESDNPQLRATSARTWRLEHATGGAKAAFDKLEEYANDDDLTVIAAVCDSVAELWETEWEELEAPARLLKWIESGKDDQQYTAKMAFLVCAVGLLKRLPGEAWTWPGLLHISAVEETRRTEIAALWRAVINDKDLSPLADEVLLEWAVRVDDVPLMRRSLTRLLWETAAADQVTAGRIHYAARNWADGTRSRTAKNSSAEVLKIFQER